MQKTNLEQAHFVRCLITTSTLDKHKVKMAIVVPHACYEAQESGIGFLAICARGKSNVFDICITYPFFCRPNPYHLLTSIYICDQ
jgi:hypothetical protein